MRAIAMVPHALTALLALAAASAPAPAGAQEPEPAATPPAPRAEPAYGLPSAPPYERGLAAIEAGDDAAALDLFEQALTADPDDLAFANEYRKAAIRSGDYDRALGFFEKLTAAHPDSAAAWLNYGYVYVDKIPDSGAITQVILANQALERFTRSIEIHPTWLALYTRGNSYLYWPKVFGRAPLAVADLERAVTMAREAPERKRVYVRSWVALGDAYWKTDRPERAREIWREGDELFPGDARLEERLALGDDEVDGYLYEHLDPSLRVDTDLDPLIGESP